MPPTTPSNNPQPEATTQSPIPSTNTAEVNAPASSALYTTGMAPAAKTHKQIPLFYVLAVVSLALLFVGIFVTGAASVLGIIAGGSAGLTGYRMKAKPLTILGYIGLGLNGIVALIFVIGLELH